MEELPFDQIEVKGGDGWATITVEDWLKRTSTERVDQIIAGQVQFKKGGQKVPTPVAIKGLYRRPATT